ncbi:MAG: ribbon-helix-helix domain-containing protein [Chloroflexi bacterium]|nr:ribbon-helix-helix domain-containing protein [Chloroflexota bacterium]
MAMLKTTVYLPAELKRELAHIAAETGLSEAELIREGILLVIGRRQLLAPHSGIFASGDPALSERVDELLAGFGADDR